jgi:PAS domain S-box-containing protein
MLSAVWSRSEPKRIAHDLADVVCRSVSAMFVYVSLRHALDAAPRIVLSTPAGSASSEQRRELTAIVEAFLQQRTPDGVSTLPNPFGPGALSIAVTAIGLDGEYGVIVTASAHEDFPRPPERLLLDVAANQAAVVVQHARSNAALRTSEAHFRSMADNAPALLWVSDATGACTYLSKQWYEFTGRTAQEDSTIGCFNNVHPDDVQHALDVFRTANTAGVPFSIDYRLQRADGEYRWAVNSGLPRFDDGQFRGFVGAVIDVHDREIGEARLRLLWEAASILLSTDDPDAMMRGLFGKVSQHLDVDTYFNYLVDETGNGLRLVSSAGVPEPHGAALQRLQFGESICGTVARHRTPIVVTRVQQSDAANVQLIKSLGIRAYACNPLLADDRLIGTLSFASRTKDAFSSDEIEFLQTLSHYVTIAHERLRLVERLRVADRRKDEFLATLAHELRNPLAPVRNAAELLRRADGNKDLVAQGVTILDRQLSHMVRLIDDLMDVARITTGKFELRKTRVELAAILMSAVEASRPLIETMGHELTLALPPPIFLDADAVRLTQVFANLLNNAAKYTDRGGRIALSADRVGEHIVVSVKDTGVGIPANLLPTVFDMFTQVDRSIHRSSGGLGLGLTLVKHLTELHGGTVSASSRGEGRGSEFVVRLPFALDAGREAPSSAQESPACLPMRVAVVDDNKDGAESLAALLRLQGHEVAVAHNGFDALQVADALRPDVMVLDIGLPGLDGYEVARHIRQQPWSSHVLLIAVSGWGQENDKRRSADVGIDYHLVKPVNPADLDRMMADHRISSRRSARD